MGRRSISSTKAGKFMNPTDQARKEARRKELKKNKKQRQQVREAVIKQKDPKHILADLDALDKLEYDTNNPPPYSAKVIQDKRKKLKETWKKIYQFYQKEDPKTAHELRMMELDYEHRHQYLIQIYESIMQAKKVKLDEIPLPDVDQPTASQLTQMNEAQFDSLAFSIPPPPPPPISITEISAPPKSILKSSTNQTESSSNLPGAPPGPPPGSPPDLSEFKLDDDEFELGLTASDPIPTDKSKKIRFNNENLVQINPILPPAPPAMIAPQLAPPLPPLPPPSLAYKQVSNSYSNLQMKNAIQIQQQASRVAQQIYQQSAFQQQQQQQQQQHHTGPQTTTIEAKPVLRNKMAEVTKFVPTNLLVRREASASSQATKKYSNEIGTTRPYDYMSQHQQKYSNYQTQSSSSMSSASTKTNTASQNNSKSTDAAYEDFMKEVSKLL